MGTCPCTPPHLRLSNGPTHFSAPVPTPSHCSTPHEGSWGWEIRCTLHSLLTPTPYPSKGLWDGVTALTTGQIPTFTPSRRHHLPSSPFLSYGLWGGGAIAIRFPWGAAHLFPVR